MGTRADTVAGGATARPELFHIVRWTVAAAVLLLPSAVCAQPQSAVIRGLVTGADGQPVAGAITKLLDGLGSPVATTPTDSSGRFLFDEVPPGTYTVFAEAAPQLSVARVITVQAALPVEIVLTLAARIAESVIVEGGNEAPAVPTRMTIAGEALREHTTRLRSRGVQQMLATLPGWASEDNGLLHVRGVDDGFLYVKDGVPVYDRLDPAFGIAPDPAGIHSINVLTGYIPPEYGLKSGAVIEVQSSVAPRSRWAGEAETAVGSDDLRSTGTLGGGPVGRRATAGLSVASERSDRFLEPVHPRNLHNEGAVVSGEAHLGVLASDSDLVKLDVSGGRSRYEVPHGDLQHEAGQDQRQELLQHSQSASWQRFWSDALVSNVALYRRAVTAELHGSPLDTPLSAASDRRHDRLGVRGGVTYARSRHTFKIGVEAAHLTLREDFTFAVTDGEAADAVGISDRAVAFTPNNPFSFVDRASRSQWAFYAQDSVRATDRLSFQVGIRFDRTRLLVPASQWSPRLGVAYSWPETSTVLRASLNRFFQPPQPEHLLLSSSAAARVLSPFAEDNTAEGTGGAEVKPERQTAWEIGIDHRLAGVVRLDAAYWSRHLRNCADPNVFFGTTIIFPNSVDRGAARGLDVRLELPRYRGWSAYATYTLSKVEQVGPINGGLFLEDNIGEIGAGRRFTPDHDQRHVSAAGLTYHSVSRGFSASLAARHGSGTPLEIEGGAAALVERPGAELVDFSRGRVRPRTVLDVTVSQTLHRSRRTETSVRAGVLNLTNHAYALNFGNPFSGTHFGAPRTVRVDVRVRIR